VTLMDLTTGRPRGYSLLLPDGGELLEVGLDDVEFGHDSPEYLGQGVYRSVSGEHPAD
jgi:hypothetical protein